MGTVPPDDARERYSNPSMARSWPIDPKAAKSVSVTLATISDARDSTAQSSAVSGASIRRIPAATPTMAASRIGMATRATDHFKQEDLLTGDREWPPLLPPWAQFSRGVAERAVDRRIDDGRPDEARQHRQERHVERAEPERRVRWERPVAHRLEVDGVVQLRGGEGSTPGCGGAVSDQLVSDRRRDLLEGRRQDTRRQVDPQTAQPAVLQQLHRGLPGTPLPAAGMAYPAAARSAVGEAGRDHDRGVGTTTVHLRLRLVQRGGAQFQLGAHHG